MVAKGIVSFGLGKDAGPESMILGKFNLGFATIEVEIIPPPVQTGGGGGPGVFLPTSEIYWQRIKITVRYKDKKWVRIWKVSKFRADAIIMVTNIINRITTNIKIGVTSMHRLFKMIRIKR